MDDQKDLIKQAVDRLVIDVVLFYLLLSAILAMWKVYLFINQKLNTYMKIITNNHYRPVLYWNELTTKEQNELKDSYDTIEESTFFRFKDWCYDLNDFLRVNDHLHGRGTDHDLYGWDGYKNESFFSSVLVKYDESYEAVKVGLALS